MSQKKLVVIGGGAAGFFCAVNAAAMNPALRVLILEKTGKLLSKVKVSGGGRCNVTHACFDITEMSRCYPRGNQLVKKTFHHFFTSDTIRWFEERGVQLKTEGDGRMFPVSDTAETIIQCLLQEADKWNVEIQTHATVTALGPITVEEEQNTFSIQLMNNRSIKADYVCIACGGYPKPIMYDWIVQPGIAIENPLPSLFTFNMPHHPLNKLMGVAVERTTVKINGTRMIQEGPLLITHWGFSGPVILKLSAWGARALAAGNYNFTITINWLPAYHVQSLATTFNTLRFQLAAQKLMNKNPFGLPQRLWEYFIQQTVSNKEIRWADLPLKEQHKLINVICSGEFVISGKTTFKEEFVTAGGVLLKEIDHQTMMSKKIPGLFFAGEALDVDGITGGYNFQHAWTSGFIAAKAIAKISSLTP